ncbi:autotransporter outer membrane beta-barrel domain-containing protein [Sphingomicrobium clamense]|uniref:Autotransporter outer membrane beta-barrel domain-containing protein n=1 Tax=Sphingomicrobium clamense TaxID=2851013 RepID=A0ABS6V801_9SPHN|nr:autotransporter outer membrane beta-barrel domain-containing protein [Sphingomicrobium sp. B8]MBW0145681.1 autotransporter outer membrane beta-barrel domain-containing protein [Sphingomicrobium sp. B8]
MAYSLSRKAALCLSATALAGLVPQAALAQDNEGEVMDALSVAPADIAAQLLALDGTDAEPDAINDASGSDYAQLFYSFTPIGMRAPDVLGLAGECEVPYLDGYEVACAEGLRLYAGVDGARYENDGGMQSDRIDTSQYSGSVGADVSIGDSGVVGGALTYLIGRSEGGAGLDTDYDGWRIGGYGTLDNGYTYFQVTGSYGRYNIDASREVEFGMIDQDLTADIDVEQITLGAHAGVRFAVGVATMLPYANIDYVRNEWDGFDEAGGSAALRIDDAVDDRLFTTLGMRFNTDIGGLVASANLGWRRMIGWRRSDIDTYFLGTNRRMDIVSAEANPDSALAGVSFGGKAGKLDFRAYYDAIFNGHETTHGFGLRLRLPLGG